MVENKTVSLVFLVVFVLFAAISGLLIWLNNQTDWRPLIIAVIPWLVPLFKMLYDSFPKIYMFVNRIIASTLNTSTRWEFSIKYSLPLDSGDYLKSASDAILKYFPDAKLWQNESNQKIIKLTGITVRLKNVDILQTGDEENNVNLFVDMTDMNVPYRMTNKMLEHRMWPLIEKVTGSLRPDVVQYTMRVKYDKPNPFFGLYIRRLPPNQITNFNCDLFEIVGGEKESVSIHKEETIIISESMNNFRTVSRKYILFSSPFAN
jgi:hypothetical protein